MIKSKCFKNIITIFLFGLIFIAGFWLRFNKVFETIVYNGDEGRDYLQAYQIWQGDLTLLGPAISSVRFYLPPTWYYLVSVPLKLGNWQIEAALLFIIIIHTITIGLFYFLGKEATNKRIGGLISAALFAFSSFMITTARQTGNHIIIPIFTAVYLIFLIKYLKNKQTKYLFISSFILGFIFSFHFSIVILIIYQLGLLIVNWLKQKRINFLSFLINSCLLFIWWFPIFIFDLRHNFVNFKGLWWYLTQGNIDELRQGFGQGTWSIINNLQTGYIFIRQSFVIGEFLPWLYLILSLAGWSWLIINRNKKANQQKFKISLYLISFVFLFIFNFIFYKGYIAPHFFFVFAPFYFILITIGLSAVIKNILFFIIFLVLIIPYPLFFHKNYVKYDRRASKVKEVSRIIAEDLNNNQEIKTYSIFLKKEKDYWVLAQEYKYLVEVKTDKQLAPNEDYSQAEVLYFVAEIPVENPLEIGNIEVKNFNPKKIIWEKEVKEYKVFKLDK